MKTVAEYLNKNKSIIPCNGKIPVIPEWQKKEFKLEDFKPDHNIGLKLKEDTDIDIDSQRALPFIYKYVQPCSAVFGRGKKPISHYLFKGISKYKKFFLHKDLEKYYKDLPHGSCLLECRSGGDKQTIMPGSIIDGEEVKWQIFEGLSPYPGNILEDLSKVALATGLSILFPSVGNRDDYCYAIACILAKHTEWKDYEIDEFVEHMAEHSGASKPKRGKGTHAYKQIANGGKLKGFNTLREILGLEDAQSLYKMFEWVGVNPPNKNLEELKKKYVYIEDSASMYNIETDIEKKKEDFNNTNLYHFPGGKNKKKAFEISGRGELMLEILLTQMRREGFEMTVSPPKVLYQQDKDGKKLEPIEEITMDLDEEYSSKVIDSINRRKGKLIDLKDTGKDKKRLIFHAPTRGLMGYTSRFLTLTKGTGVINRIFHSYGRFEGEMEGRRNGALISMEQGKAVAFAIFNLQARGEMFITHNDPVYTGMIVGLAPKPGDMIINVMKGKKLTNMRTQGTDENVVLTPVRKMSIAEQLSILNTDEALEITPKSCRLRKAILNPHERKKSEKVLAISNT